MININYYNESSHKYLPGKLLCKGVDCVAQNEINVDGSINIIVCSDEYIHDLNTNYLGHDYTTDVITFEIEDNPIDGEIYISADTALAQSKEYNCSLQDELLRLAIHGALHLSGHTDSTDEERKLMSDLEDKYIKLVKAKS